MGASGTFDYRAARGGCDCPDERAAAERTPRSTGDRRGDRGAVARQGNVRQNPGDVGGSGLTSPDVDALKPAARAGCEPVPVGVAAFAPFSVDDVLKGEANAPYLANLDDETGCVGFCHVLYSLRVCGRLVEWKIPGLQGKDRRSVHGFTDSTFELQPTERDRERDRSIEATGGVKAACGFEHTPTAERW